MWEGGEELVSKLSKAGRWAAGVSAVVLDGATMTEASDREKAKADAGRGGRLSNTVWKGR